MSTPARRFLLTAISCLLVWASFLPARGVWAPDEARYAEVTREMAREGRWLIPLLNGETYTEKPPLFFDLARLAALPAGEVPEWAVKVPSLLGALLTLLSLAFIGVRLMGAEGAWLPPLLLGTMFKFSWQAQFGQIDMLLCGLVAAQIALGLRLAQGQGRRAACLAGMVLLATAGVLSKGPVGCLLPWLVLAAYCSARRDWAGLGRLGLQWVAPLVILLTLGWLWAASFAAGPEYAEVMVFKQSLARYVDPWHHKAPFYYYLGVFWTDGLPYSLLLVPMATPLLLKKTWREPGALLALVWMGVYLLFFSLSPGKRTVYILPLFPAMALLLAYGLLNIRLGRWPSGGLRRAFLVLAGLFPALLVWITLKSPLSLAGVKPWLWAGGLLLGAGACTAWRLCLRGRPLSAAAAMAISSLAFLALTATPVVRTLDPLKTPKALAAAIRPSLERGGALGLYAIAFPSINYYARTRTTVFGKDQRSEALAFLRESGDNLLLAEKEKWPVDPDTQELLADATVGNEKWLLLRGKPGGDAGRRDGPGAVRE